MEGKLIFKYDRWYVDKVDEDLLIPLCKTDDDYIKSLDDEYIVKAVTNRLVEFTIITEFSHPEQFDGVAWGDGEIQALLVNNRRHDTWDDIYMKHRHLPDGDFIDMLHRNYYPPRTKMPF